MAIRSIAAAWRAALVLVHATFVVTILVLRSRLKVASGDCGQEIHRRAVQIHNHHLDQLSLTNADIGLLEVATIVWDWL